MAETPKRYVRVEDALWRKASAKARSEGTTLSKLFRAWLQDYADDRSIDEELALIIERLSAVRRRLDV